jgi:hypothetical protein
MNRSQLKIDIVSDVVCPWCAIGYKKLSKAMEDLKVHYDSSVRTSSGDIIQFVYADDGMDAIHIESQPLFLTKLSMKDLQKKFQLDPNEKWSAYLTKPTLKFKLKHKKEFNFNLILEQRYIGYSASHHLRASRKL